MNLPSVGRTLDLCFDWTCSTTLDSALLIGLVLGLQRFGRKQLGVRGCYLLSLLVLARLLLPSIPLGHWSVVPPADHLWRPSLPSRPALAPRPTAPDPTAAPKLSNVLIQEGASEQTDRRSELPLLPLIWALGLGASLVWVHWRHRRFSVWVRAQPQVSEPRLVALLEEAKALMRVEKPIRIVAFESGGTPALFGWLKPRLLFPQGLTDQLRAPELKMVLLHELAHVKRNDILLNWLMILARSLHWFNPLVWVALRRLRAERELMCDAMVLSVLQEQDHHVYGGTLIKLMDAFSSQPPAPSLVPILNHKHEIKRRIIMISNFKPASRTAWTLTTAILIALCCLTFTRAAGPNKHLAAPALASPAPTPASGSDKDNDLDGFRRRLNELDETIIDAQHKVDLLRAEISRSGGGTDGRADLGAEPETIRILERQRITSESMAARYQALSKELRGYDATRLAQAIPTAIPDTELTQLLRDLNSAEAHMASLTSEMGPEHPQRKSLESTLSAIRKQIANRVEGVLNGLAAQVASQQASVESLTKQLQELRKRESETTERYVPYLRAKGDLERLEKVRDTLMLQFLERQFGQPNKP